ncbi:MAG TPA: C25 family cysteine peptidase [Anaerolineaceae bacterium]|nr:C25 family cysteine peptidase [Anaerolineaceae bacterium]HQC20355.1 C25 family cysteine peptidase [Anaerolineaceae bacterium]
MIPYRLPKNDEAMIVRRGKFLTLVQTAMNKRELQFVRQACLIWLASYPGDLLVNYIYAAILAELGDTEMAVGALQKIIAYDPEFTEAMSLLSQLVNGEAIDIEYHSSLAYLQRNPAPVPPIAKWFAPFMNARQAYEAGDQSAAEKAVLQALAHNPSLPLPAILHMRIIHKNGNMTLLDTLAGIYGSRWQDCIQIKLLSALADMQQGEDARGVEKLHWSAAHDVSGQAANRLLGVEHAFKPIWPDDLKVYFDLPIPASIAVELGWNALATPAAAVSPATPLADAGTAPNQLGNTSSLPVTQKISDFTNTDEIDHSEVPPEAFLLSKSPDFGDEKHTKARDETVASLNEIQAEFDRIAKSLRKSELSTADARFPNYVLMSSKTALTQKYGANTANVIIDAMQDLAIKITALPGWNSVVLVPDDPRIANDLGLTPSQTNEAWNLKLALAELDKKLAEKGEMIGTLLIIGGNDIVPFHQLPNPTDDADTYVPSDNPYATVDDNYFIPQWPVGRIPDEAGSDPVYLIEQLRYLNNEYALKLKAKTIISGTVFESWIFNLRESIFATLQSFRRSEQLGYCAEVWRIPSADVFSVIDRGDRIKSSPPEDTSSVLARQKSNPSFGYFNLHGLKDAPEWFGQSDLARRLDSPEYPVAVVPSLFSAATPAPDIVLSEACYGANILEKTAGQSVALNLLSAGSRSFVGSTCIAYGSVNKPLVGADLLAHSFWTQVQNSMPVGYALMRAKLTLASKMTQAQGYLDGEDQKTILSFVLYGDPLANKDSLRNIPKPLLRPAKHLEIKTISDSHEEMVVTPEEMPNEILDNVRKVISEYLPGLDNATVAINPQLTNFSLDPLGAKDRKSRKVYLEGSERYVVTLRKSVEIRQISHEQYARMTFDHKGEMIKLSLSK